MTSFIRPSVKAKINAINKMSEKELNAKIDQTQTRGRQKDRRMEYHQRDMEEKGSTKINQQSFRKMKKYWRRLRKPNEKSQSTLFFGSSIKIVK